MAMRIQEAQKIRQHARICYWGTEKSGKTHAALELGRFLAGPEGKVGVISSERGSSGLLAWKFPHDIINLTMDEGNNLIRNPFTPKRYEEAIQTFVNAGYQVIIVDSLSHLWEGEGGVLEIVGSQNGDTFTSGWGKGTPIYQHVLNTLLNVPCHLIATLRAKDSYVLEEYVKRDGKIGHAPVNKGSAPIIRKGFGFEMQLTIRQDDKVGYIQSSAYEEELPKGMAIENVSEDFAPVLLRWLEGAPPPERVPTIKDSYKRGLETGAWAKDTFYHTIGATLNYPVAVTNATVYTNDQLRFIAQLAEDGAQEKDDGYVSLEQISEELANAKA